MYDVVGLAPASRLGSGVHFSFYDSIKIALLLVGIIFAVTVLRSFMSVERTRALLGGKREGVGNVVAAGVGVVTPFCSCSAVPAFIGFVAAGVPLGVTLSFLIASPLVNEVAIALLFGIFGIGPTLLYVAAGLVIAMVAGFVGPTFWSVSPWAQQSMGGHQRTSSPGMPEPETPSRCWSPCWSVYRCTPTLPASCPSCRPCTTRGLPMGTLLAFMMAVVALSLPELILLRRVLKPQLIATFVAVTGAGIIAVGYLFNAVLA